MKGYGLGRICSCLELIQKAEAVGIRAVVFVLLGYLVRRGANLVGFVAL